MMQEAPEFLVPGARIVQTPRLIELNLFYDLAIRKQPPKNREGGRSQAEEPFDLPELRPVTLFDGCANVPAGCTDDPMVHII